MQTFTLADVKTWRDATVRDPKGDKVGSVDDIYLDRHTGEPAWLAVNTGLFGMRQSFVPLEGATRDGDDVRVSYPKDTIKDAPNIDPEGTLSADEEQRLYAHYGRDWGTAGSDERFSRIHRYDETI